MTVSFTCLEFMSKNESLQGVKHSEKKTSLLYKRWVSHVQEGCILRLDFQRPDILEMARLTLVLYVDNKILHSM